MYWGCSLCSEQWWCHIWCDVLRMTSCQQIQYSTITITKERSPLYRTSRATERVDRRTSGSPPGPQGAPEVQRGLGPSSHLQLGGERQQDARHQLHLHHRADGGETRGELHLHGQQPGDQAGEFNAHEFERWGLIQVNSKDISYITIMFAAPCHHRQASL